ncbi:MAG TPA: glycosyltransferase family 2 protein [candidate division Zixibacteria bacterium]|nr:glycosyltransferase family 2 protein [candidate division Zixibacteria bacterium]
MSAPHDSDRLQWLQRFLEMVPGIISWAIIIGPIWLSFSYPWLVAYFVLSFDFYWLCRALWFAGAVIVAFGRIRHVLRVDWRRRLEALHDPAARREELLRRLAALSRQPAPGALGFAAGAAARIRLDGRAAAERRLIERELADLERLDELAEPPPDFREYYHLALIPTYTEPLEKLRATVRALVEADWPKGRKICAIITRETDEAGRANVAALREEFGHAFAEFIHILDPLEPGIVIGKSSAMAFGGRYVYRLLVRERGMDARRILVTDLDADYRVHPQYFTYLTWVHLTDANRETQLYQPIPYFHNNLWQAPFLQRLFAAVLTQLQMWRSVLPEKLQSFGSYSTTLHLIHDVGYWATDAIPEDSRFYWKSYFRYGDRFRAVPLFIPIYGDAVRARTYWRSMAQQYLQARRWAWGVTDIPYVVRNVLEHGEISLASRVWRLLNLFGEHVNWAIAPFVVMFGATIPLIINPAFGETILGQNLPFYASTMLTIGLVALAVLIWVEHHIVPPRPADWGPIRRALVYVQWLGLPFVGIFFSNLPALDAQTRLLTGRYLEYRVTEKA